MRLPAARGRAGLRLAVLALAAFGGMTAAGAIAAPAASAHAVLVSSIPVDGSRVNTAPAQVRLTFDEPVGLIAADEQVISATGARADTGQVRLAEGGTTIVLPPRPHLPRGTHSPRRPGHDPAHPDRRGRSRASPHRDRDAVIDPGGRAAPDPAPPHPGRLAVDRQRRGRPAAGVWTLTLDVALGPADAYATSASYRVW